MSGKKMRRLPLYAIVAVFALPMMLASILFYYHDFFPLRSLNQGTLIVPLVKTESDSRHRWQVVYVAEGTCDQQCLHEVHQLHQMVRLLGQEAGRVSVIRRDRFQNLTVERIYLVDPQGNVFMYYPRTVDPMAIYKDLKRLLTVSQVG